ncbi:MAG: hypothetical protein Q8O67_29045 [Deltaproteobacteria bacterium]|nr:hypothetical protein [Deltaproteobacteria bacterium]
MADLKAGDIVGGRFVIERALASGGMGAGLCCAPAAEQQQGRDQGHPRRSSGFVAKRMSWLGLLRTHGGSSLQSSFRH